MNDQTGSVSQPFSVAEPHKAASVQTIALFRADKIRQVHLVTAACHGSVKVYKFLGQNLIIANWDTVLIDPFSMFIQKEYLASIGIYKTWPAIQC